ncbi:hypothetical protein [Candidatus Villigracilis affinis]|uniref:hypothetical protein n=1 Tax=Candidatus Villigracilis affinis TaxID=3140682 RepID=UPI002A1CED7E|nr:hypothetical protein [Anaerolineales bacterium]
MKVTYVNSRDNAIKSALAFDNLTKKWKHVLFFRSTVISVIVLLFILYRNYSLQSGIRIDDIYYPLASLIYTVFWGAPLSLLIGWTLYKFSLVSRQNAIMAQFEGLPKDYFGQTDISLEPDGITLRTPYFRIVYDRKMTDTIMTTQDFIFLCLGAHCVLSIPISALGAQQSESIIEIEKFVSVTARQQKLSSAKA